VEADVDELQTKNNRVTQRRARDAAGKEMIEVVSMLASARP
jgi:hypothetical protein